jgi:hypothetical protein
MSDQNQAPSPEGVMHGPYPQTQEHPFDQLNGHYDAIDSANISHEDAEDLRDNLGQIAMEAYDEDEQLRYEREEEESAYQEPHQPTEQELQQDHEDQFLSGEDLAEYEHGKKHGMYNN